MAILYFKLTRNTDIDVILRFMSPNVESQVFIANITCLSCPGIEPGPPVSQTDVLITIYVYRTLCESRQMAVNPISFYEMYSEFLCLHKTHLYKPFLS